MRIPIRTPSGTYAFRQRVLSDLQIIIGRKLIKKTLRTSNLASAGLRAIVLASGYAHAYDLLRVQRVDRISKKDLDALVGCLSTGADRRDLKLHRTRAADGTVTELADRQRRRCPSVPPSPKLCNGDRGGSDRHARSQA